MDQYKVVKPLGEGSFGRVYKAEQLSQKGRFVALKIISKRGRSEKELKGFRKECDIQRQLHHPNIIQMLDSFETAGEIVVITEFAPKELSVLLGKKGYLAEDRVQPIVWDLVSALHYLHSNRVLHRDLKPQNILLDVKDRAKLCDFGFARNMSTGTHVLTSIKGTPLYMAPELIEEQPYDYSADLWSLGCIIYELLMGTPPFCTTSILHLIRLIKHEQIKWPNFVSQNCITFLKGLLQKNPAKRMTWKEIERHPFVKGHIISAAPVEDSAASDTYNEPKLPLTDSLPSNIEAERQLQVEQHYQRKSLVQVNTDKPLESLKSEIVIENRVIEENKPQLIIEEDNQPIETEEWIAFLQKTIQEVVSGGEFASLTQTNLTSILIAPLRNTNCTSKVLSFVARLLALPFALRTEPDDDILQQVQKVYVDVKLVPNLIYASKLMMRYHHNDDDDTGNSNDSQNEITGAQETFKSLDQLTDDDFQALEYIFLLLAHLVHVNDKFLIQFCDAIVVLNMYAVLKLFIIAVKRKQQLTQNLLAILTHMVRRFPEHLKIIDKLLTVNCSSSNEAGVQNQINFVEFLRHECATIRERTCYLLLFMMKAINNGNDNLNSGSSNQMNNLSTIINILSNNDIKDTLEVLVYDSIESVRNAAEVSVEELRNFSKDNTQQQQ